MESSTKAKASTCEICNANFGFTRRTHQCKRCKRSVCSNCGRGKRIIVGYKDNLQHRTCDVCEHDIQFQVKLRLTNNLAWNSLSEIGKEWLASIPNLKQLQEETPFDVMLQESEKIGKKDDNFNELEADLASGTTDRSSFNHSFHEFLQNIQANSTPQQCQVQIRDVLKAECMRNPTVGYTQGLNLVVAFLLCFLDEENAFYLLTHLIENILPPHFYSKIEKGVCLYGYKAESFVIKNVLKDQLNLKKKEDISAMEDFIDVALPSLLVPLLVDTLNVHCLFNIWDKMIKEGDFLVLEKALITILMGNKGLVIDQDLLAGRRYQEILCKDVTHEFMQTKAKLTTVTAEQILKLRKDFELFFEEELEKRDHKSIKEICEAKAFTKIEIDALYSEYKAKVKSRGGKKTSVNKQEFKLLLAKIASDQYELMLGALNIFDLIDIDKDAVLEHGEFLACLVLLMKESFEEQMIWCFKNYDKSQKNYLTVEDYQIFLETISRVCVVVMREESDPYLLRKIARFKKEMIEAVKSGSKIKYVDVQDNLNKDDLIIEVSRALQGERRKSSVVRKASRLSLFEKGQKDSKLDEKEATNQDMLLETEMLSEGRKRSSKLVLSLNQLKALDDDEVDDLKTTHYTNEYLNSIVSIESAKEQEGESVTESLKNEVPSSTLEAEWDDFPCSEPKFLLLMSQNSSDGLSEHAHPSKLSQTEAKTKFEQGEYCEIMYLEASDLCCEDKDVLTEFEKRKSHCNQAQGLDSTAKFSVLLTQSDRHPSSSESSTKADELKSLSHLAKFSEHCSKCLECHSPANLSTSVQVPKILLTNPAQHLTAEKHESRLENHQLFNKLEEKISFSLDNQPLSDTTLSNKPEIILKTIPEHLLREEHNESGFHKESLDRQRCNRNSLLLENEDLELLREDDAKTLEFREVNDIVRSSKAETRKETEPKLTNESLEHELKRSIQTRIVDKGAETTTVDEAQNRRSPITNRSVPTKAVNQQHLPPEKIISKARSNYTDKQPPETRMLTSQVELSDQESSKSIKMAEKGTSAPDSGLKKFVKEEEKSAASLSESAKSFEKVNLEPPQDLTHEDRSYSVVSSISKDSFIITNMKGASKTQIDAIRDNNRGKFCNSDKHCQGCTIF